MNSAFNISFFSKSKRHLIDEIFEACHNSFSYVVTPNVNHVVQLAENDELKQAYHFARWRVCDSKILLPCLRFLNVTVPEVIPGSTLTQDLFDIANQRQLAVNIVGAQSEEVDKLRAIYPNIVINHFNPPMGFINDPKSVAECIEFVVGSPSPLTFLALGCPRQEVLAQKILESGAAVGIGLCVGASISFLSGSIKRAPEWLQKISCEWVYRMLSEPRRLVKRYVFDAVKIVPLLLIEVTKK